MKKALGKTHMRLESLMILVGLMFFLGCHGDHSPKSIVETDTSTTADAVKKQKAINDQMTKGDRPDDGQETPTYAEEMHSTLKSYKEIKQIDTLIIDGNDSLRIHIKHYCLHDSAIIVLKSYMSAWGKEYAIDFTTHNFATKITVLNNRDTIFNKIIKKKDFDNVIRDQLKQYAVLFNPYFRGYNKTRGFLIFGYSISIPMTDIGVPASLTIDKKGHFKVWDEYAKLK